MKITNKRVDKREKDIKKKLSAAILMLLVSCIMVVTSTYAWFTLSTAPEVTGIQTTIGGNGNLEIALATDATWADPTKVVTLTGTATNVDVNTTWGNLVSLSNNTVDYGLDEITLYPARLNAANGVVSAANPLIIPNYGADGRITDITGTTLTGTYNSEKAAFGTTGNGVRAIGTSSNMSDLEYAWYLAVTAVRGERTTAKAIVQNAIGGSNGGALADIMIKYVNDASTTFTDTDKATIVGLVNSLSEANGHIKNAITSALIAYTVGSDATFTVTDANLATITSFFAGLDIDTVFKDANASSYTFTITGLEGSTMTISSTDKSELYSTIKEYLAIKAGITLANEKLALLTDHSYTWTEIEATINPLFDYSKINVEGKIFSELKKYSMEEMLAIYTKYNALPITFGKDSGVIYDFAELVGNINVNVDLKDETEIIFGGASLSVGTMNAIMNTEQTSETNNPWVPKVAAVIGADSMKPATGATGGSKMTTFYGYALDLLFRTNAKESNLLLTTEARDRVYADATDSVTQGGGSTMDFTVSPDFPISNMLVLMKAIKIAFVDGSASSTLYAEAGLDPTTVKFYDAANNLLTPVDKNASLDGIQHDLDGNKVKCTVTSEGTTTETYVEVANIKADIRFFADDDIQTPGYQTSKNNTLITDSSAQVIRSLPQNQEVRVSAIVYLDGDVVENKHVTNGAVSMTGSLNLQFASSASLTPMDYTFGTSETPNN